MPTPLTVGRLCELLRDVDESAPIYLPNLNGPPDSVIALATVQVETLTATGVSKVWGVAFLAEPHLLRLAKLSGTDSGLEKGIKE